MKKLTVEKELKNISSVLTELINNKNISFVTYDLSNEYHKNISIEPMRYEGNKLDGMQILYEDGIYEVSEFQAGKNADELHIYLETRSFKIALKNMLKGNKRKPVKVWN